MLSPFFNGSVADAVAKTKASNLLFVVAIYGKDLNCYVVIFLVALLISINR